VKFQKLANRQADSIAELKRNEERLASIEEILRSNAYREILEPALRKKFEEHAGTPTREDGQSYEEFGMTVEVTEKIRKALAETLQMLPKERDRLIKYLSETARPQMD